VYFYAVNCQGASVTTMKVYANKLKQQISSKLHPVYVISGDEPMQLNECCDWVRKKARIEGYLERTIFAVDIDPKPHDFSQSADNMSLFDYQYTLANATP